MDKMFTLRVDELKETKVNEGYVSPFQLYI